MIQPKFPQTYKGNYIAGGFRQPADPNGQWTLKSPADSKDVIAQLKYSYAEVDEAVDAATEAYRTWRKTPVEERIALLKKYQDALKRRGDEICEVISREMGKPLWESKTELGAMTGKIDITINDTLPLVSDREFKDIMPGTTGALRYRPMGVMAVVGPFNFPGHLPNGHIVPALLTGNTVVFKPSEKTPLTGQLMAECFHEAGFPKGVFNVIHGEREVGRRLVIHEGVAGVLFTGSYDVGTRIKQDTLQQHWKLLALEMGGKNSAIVWDDADLDVAVRDVLFGAYVTTGQRCSATSRVIVHPSMAQKFLDRFHERAKAFRIGHPLDTENAPFMGPLIDSASVDRLMKFMGIAQREGHEIIMRSKALEVDGYAGNYVSPSICWAGEISVEDAKKSVYQQTEIFAPSVAIMQTPDLDQAIALANCTQFGLVASVFTKSREIYQRCLDDLEVGLVNWNKPTVGASSKLPFGGLKKSGNHFPTALTAGSYCTHPVACLETEAPAGGSGNIVGLNWE